MLVQKYSSNDDCHPEINTTSGTVSHMRNNAQQLEIWGKAQRESAKRHKSDWGRI